MNIIDDLNEKQREAVLETEGYVRVIAGAGSGKTKLLVSRYAYLVKEYGIDPANILCVTFTNKAAGEMKRRIRAIIGGEYDTALICTYHGFCARMLREDAAKLFLSRDFQIIDAVQQKTILSEIYQKRELKLDYVSFEKMLKLIDKYKSVYYHDYVPKMCESAPGQIMASVATMDDEIIEEYMQRQKAVNALDFNDLLSFALYLLETDEEVRSHWQEKLNYIQVDEFQDSSGREMKLVDILSGHYHNLMIVGDPDQNIYEWRGSDVKLLVEFDTTHVPTKTIILNRNYRSTPQILNCANHLIDNNVLRLKKDLFTLLPEGANVMHYHFKSDEKEKEQIAQLIKKAVKRDGKKYSDIAVLYRSGFLSRLIERKLVEKNIPYEIYGGVRFYQRMEVLDMIAYLRVIAFGDDISTKRIINKPRRRFGRVKLSALEELQESYTSDGTGAKLFDILSENLGEAPFKNSDAGQFVDLILRLREEADKLKISEIVNRVATGSGYEEYIRSLGDEERYENLMEFKRVAEEFERDYGEDISLPQFLQHIALQTNEDSEKEKDSVKLMTIHAAKGLEFPVVMVVGLSEGVFPSSKTIEERKQLGLEEERRLCYVAITRAMEQLYLMDSEGFSQNGIKKLPSRFLREIGTDNYDRIGNISDVLDKESREYSEKLDTGLTGHLPGRFNPGDVVEHHAFGKGTVVEYNGLRNSIVVEFEKIGQKRTISAEYFDCIHTPVIDVQVEFEIDDTEISEESFEQHETEEEQPSVIINEFEYEPVKITKKEEDEIKKKLSESPNLWKHEEVPHSGWTCTSVRDLGAPTGICEMCGNQIIRYVHHMTHPDYHPLEVGCVCAGKMEGNINCAKRRESDLKNEEARRNNFINRKWKLSKNGNLYIRVKDHFIFVGSSKDGKKWKYSIDLNFCTTSFSSKREAMSAAFDALEMLTR